MALRFQHSGYHWTIREGFPSMGARETEAPSFVEMLKAAHADVAKLTMHELASWIVARLAYLTCGALEIEGNDFAHDTNEIGYKLKICDDQQTMLAQGAIVIHASRIYFAGLNIRVDDFQSIVVQMLTSSPRELSTCEIRFRHPETRKTRRYGWDGYALLQ